jgi:acetate kinase
MQHLGIEINKEENNIRKKGIREINTIGSKVKVLITPTNEEFEIARQTFELLK